MTIWQLLWSIVCGMLGGVIIAAVSVGMDIWKRRRMLRRLDASPRRDHR